MDLGIEIAGLGRATRRKRDFTRTIGCYDPDTRKNKFIRFHKPAAPEMLVLRFVDLDEPPPSPHHERPELRMPSREHVEKALTFDRPGERLLVHCHAGISRSSTVALAIIANRLGTGREEEALRLLLAIRPHAVPNLAVLRHADEILGNGGRLAEIVRAHEGADSPAAIRRRENWEAYLTFYKCLP
jgi:predicted protein tyrosine phosphatase